MSEKERKITTTLLIGSLAREMKQGWSNEISPESYITDRQPFPWILTGRKRIKRHFQDPAQELQRYWAFGSSRLRAWMMISL